MAGGGGGFGGLVLPSGAYVVKGGHVRCKTFGTKALAKAWATTIEQEIDQLATRADTFEREIAALESREDEVYQRWREKYYALRYQAPIVTRLFQSAFQIAPQSQETSC